VGVGSINFNDAISYSVSGPVIRSIGIKKDIRLLKSETYASYWFLSMHSFLGKRGDSYDRFLIRIREMYESINIVFQVLSNLTNNDSNVLKNKKKTDFFSFFNLLYKERSIQLNKKTKYTSMENLIKHFKKYSEGITVNKGFSYNAVEAPKGEFGVSLISDGSSKPYRCKIRTPAYHHMHVMSRMCQGHYMADLVTVLGSQDIVFGDVDR
jgi:NADH-quinone oxidoreductase subunit D